jgi:hypothetical protein
MKYRTLPMLRTLSKLTLLHKLERGTADSTDAWVAAENIINGDPCDNWPVCNIGGSLYLITWRI